MCKDWTGLYSLLVPIILPLNVLMGLQGLFNDYMIEKDCAWIKCSLLVPYILLLSFFSLSCGGIAYDCEDFVMIPI